MSIPEAGTTDLCVRALHIMSNGTLADFEAVFRADAYNRESVEEPPSCRGTGPAAFHATALWLRTAFADLTWEIHDTVTERDLVVLHATMSGRQVGPFIGYDEAGVANQAFPATGHTFAVTQTHWFRAAGGKIVEHWANRDDLGMALQLHWAPPTPLYLLRMARALRAARRADR